VLRCYHRNTNSGKQRDFGTGRQHGFVLTQWLFEASSSAEQFAARVKTAGMGVCISCFLKTDCSVPGRRWPRTSARFKALVVRPARTQ